MRLVVLKSFATADRAQRGMNLLLLLVGMCALLAGTALMLAISAMVTRPLEHLARHVRAFGSGATDPGLPVRGTLEVRELSVAFANMELQIQQKNRALLESERLATIGRMANSVSHDLRHYLAAVYANAEFLASSRTAEHERAELLADIQVAVHGTTELIESLLIFGRTSGSLQRTSESVARILERALILVRAHPDAGRVRFHSFGNDAAGTAALVDAKQVERAIYNLLLNACQAAAKSTAARSVIAEVKVATDLIEVHITDDGPGVSDLVRNNLFDPFVSEGKQNGTGLGLTLAHVVAQEHGGSVRLMSSRPGETVFVLTLARTAVHSQTPEQENSAEVAP